MTDAVVAGAPGRANVIGEHAIHGLSIRCCPAIS